MILGNKTDDIVELEKLLNNTLDKLPSTSGTYFRGIGKAEITKINNYQIGDEIPYENFFSTSKTREIEGCFARKRKVQTEEAGLIEVQSKNGKSIKKYSTADFEEEILHKSNTKFILHDVNQNQLLNTFEHQVDGMPAVYGNKYIFIEK